MLARIIAIIALILASIQPVWGADVADVRIGIHPHKTRMVIELTTKVPYRIFTLQDPYRVVVDLPEVTWKIPPTPHSPAGSLITNYRFGLFQAGNSRLVIDVKKPVRVAGHVMLPPTKRHPYRLVVDLAPVTTAQFARTERQFESKDWVEPSVRQAPAARAPSRSHKGLGPEKRIVMLDPGHGGVDPGTIGVTGIEEKNVTLQVAKRVKRTLEATGRYKVLMTRNKDVYVPLRKRYQKAEAAGAELFISLHADSNSNPRIRGTSVYTLSEKSSDREAAALAAKENRSDAIAGIDLSKQSDAVASFLIELRQRQTMNESALFSESLIHEVGTKSKLLHNTHRFAGFAVLKSPDVPSVLIELGYLSNRRDERALINPRHQKVLAGAILRATDEFFERMERLSRS